MEIVSIKNILLPTQYQNLSEFINNNNFNWHYKKHVHYVQDENTTQTSDSHGLITMFYNENKVLHPDYDKVVPVLFNLVDILNKKLKQLHRIHGCLTININKDHCYYPHTDYEPTKMNKNWYTAVYYLGDSDGDTVFFEDDEKTIKHIQPFESNSAVVFNGAIKHSGSLPRSHSNRVILNYNFEME